MNHVDMECPIEMIAINSMAKQFKLQVLTPAALVVDEQVESIIAPGEDGYLGVLADHAPLMVTLGAGSLTIRTNQYAVREIHIEGGFLEVLNNTATILTDRVSTTILNP